VPKYILIIALLIGFGTPVFAQVKSEAILVSKDTVKDKEINPLSPAKAAFYSAIFPGLGQAYNKRYWKMPLVYGAIGTSFYFYNSNNKRYHEFRNEYKDRLLGITNPKYAYLDNDRLIRAQKFYQRNRDLSVLITCAFYVLNIVDANVDAHLKQFNVSDNLTFTPSFQTNEFDYKPNVGFAINYKF